MATSPSLSSDVDVSCKSVKGKLCLLKRNWKYVVDIKWDSHILLYQKNITLVN